MNINQEEPAQIKLHRRRVISLLEEADRLREATKDLWAHDELVSTQTRITMLNKEALAELALIRELIKQNNLETNGF